MFLYRQGITCPSLPIPTNGGKKGCEDTVSELYDTLCSFYCSDGYSLVGSSARRCLENGTWSGETSLCLRKKQNHFLILKAYAYINNVVICVNVLSLFLLAQLSRVVLLFLQLMFQFLHRLAHQ